MSVIVREVPAHPPASYESIAISPTIWSWGLSVNNYAFFTRFTLFVLDGISLIETLYPPCRIYDLLLARHEGVTLRAYLYFDVFFGRLGCNNISAYTSDGCFRIFRMNTLLHKLLFILLTNLKTYRLSGIITKKINSRKLYLITDSWKPEIPDWSPFYGSC